MDEKVKKAIREYFADIGRRGGQAKSEAKRKAVIENGKKGVLARLKRAQ